MTLAFFIHSARLNLWLKILKKLCNINFVIKELFKVTYLSRNLGIIYLFFLESYIFTYNTKILYTNLLIKHK